MARQRLRAFVSSRIEELAAERRIVKAELDKLFVDAWVFERDAGARPQTIQQTYLKEIESADLYIGIFWRGYGPYTIEEYDHAFELGKSCLVYEKRSALEERDPRLTSFLDKIGKVEAGLTVRWFETPEQLGDFVKQDVAAWQAELVRSATPRGYAAPFQAPALGDLYVERSSMMDRLCEKLLALDGKGLPLVTRAALYGIGGVGKTITVAAFARIDAVRKRFPDGVLWVTLGQNPDLTRRISDWGRSLYDPELTAVGYVDEIAGTNRLRTLLSKKACLLAVDDVWQAAHARPFLVGGPRCLLLITTRISEISDEIGASAIELNEMTPAEALALVEKWSGAVGDVDRENAEWLMRKVGYLPLALELIGAQVRKLGSWETYRRRWDSEKLKAIRHGRRSRGKQDNLWDSLELSVEALSAKDRRSYFSLGVFPEDTPFPSRACAALWGSTEDEAADLLTDLVGQSLLRERTEFNPRRYAFHDLFYEFVAEHLGSEGRVQANRTLIEGYRHLCGGEWHNGPDDAYFFEHLAEHLAAAGLASELYKLIDRRWMAAQFRSVHSHRAFASDLGKALTAAVSETPPNLFQIVRATFIRATLGSLASRTDPETLAALCRIGQVQIALGHAEMIQEPTKRSYTYRLIAEALLARDEAPEARLVLQDALLAARSVEQVHHRSTALSDLVGTIMDAGEPDLARRVAANAEAAAKAETHKYFIPDLLIRSARAHRRIGNNLQSDALATVALAAIDREEDAIRKLAYLIRLEEAFARTGNVDRAREIEANVTAAFEEVNSAIGGNKDIYLGYAPELSDAFLEVGDFDRAVIIAERWVGQSWQGAGALARAACALLPTGELERASRIAEQSAEIVAELLRGEQYSFQLEERINSLAYVTEALARTGRDEKAVELAAVASLDPEAKSHALGTIALALAHRNQVEGARRAAEASLAASLRLPDDGARKGLWFAAVAKALNGVGKKAEAIETASRVLCLAENWEGDDWRLADNLQVLLEILTELGERAKAMEVIERFQDVGKKPEGLIRLIRSFADSPDQVRALANRLAESVRELNDATKVDALGGAANALSHAGFGTEATNLARLAVAAASEIEDLNRGPADGLCEAAQALAHAGRFDEARDVAEKISVQRSENPSRTISKKVRALGALAEALEVAGQHERAVSTAHDALDSAREALVDETDMYTFRSEALTVAARALIRVGDSDNAERANRDALDLALNKLMELGA